jgi:hypothetical protein
MGAIQYLLEDKAGTVYFDAPRVRPSAGVVTIKTSGNGDLPDTAVEDQTIIVDGYQRTVKAWVASDPRSIEVDPGPGESHVGRRYLTRTAADKRETAEVVGVVAGAGSDVIEIADKLPHALAVGDYVESTRVSYELTAAQLADRGLFRCVWTYTADGENRISETLFRTVRAFPHCPGTAAGLRAAYSDLVNQWNQFVMRDGSWSARIKTAWAAVLQEVEGRKVLDGAGGPIIDRIVDWSQAEATLYQRVLLDMAATNRPNDDWSAFEWMQHREARYKHEMSLWMNSIRWFDDADADRSLTAGESGKDMQTTRMSR